MPFLANSVPVYFGAPNIEQYQPGPHSFINMRDFASPAALAKHLKYLATHESEYQKYFAWRKTQRGIPQTLKRIEQLSMHRPSISCDLCACICDKSCRRSGADILQYPHLPQISPWEQQPTTSQHKRSAFGRKQGVAQTIDDAAQHRSAWDAERALAKHRHHKQRVQLEEAAAAAAE